MISRLNFNRAFIISLLWHLLCFFMVTVVIMPSGTSRRKLSNISFLGSILDDNSFAREFKVSEPASSKQGDKKEKFFLSVKTTEPAPVEFHADRDYFLESRPYKSSVEEILSVQKSQFIAREKETSLQADRGSSEIEGEAGDRTIIFKPDMPGIKGSSLSGIKKDELSAYYKIKLKLIIAADGNVKSVENLQTSGYPGLDLAATRYVKEWKFAPLSPDKPQYDQEGMVLLELKPEPQMPQIKSKI